MTDLATMMRSAADHSRSPRRASLEPVLTAFADVTTEVVGFEAANKNLSKIRRRVEDHVPSILTKGGRERADKNATLLISMDQFVDLMSRLVERIEADAVRRRPADALLAELTPIKGKGTSVAVARGAHEETVGGHVRF